MDKFFRYKKGLPFRISVHHNLKKKRCTLIGFGWLTPPKRPTNDSDSFGVSGMIEMIILATRGVLHFVHIAADWQQHGSNHVRSPFHGGVCAFRHKRF